MKIIQTIIFYILSFTWGIIMSSIGAIISVILLICGQKPKLFHGRIYFAIGKNWGGVNFGPFFFVDSTPTLHTKQHECGHGIQNIILGPLMPFIVCIPSAMRYWLYRTADKNDTEAFCSFALVILLLAVLAFVLAVSLGNIIASFATGFLSLYIGILFIWSVFHEEPKFEARPFPKYDSIWFEGMATKLGEKYFIEEEK